MRESSGWKLKFNSRLSKPRSSSWKDVFLCALDIRMLDGGEFLKVGFDKLLGVVIGWDVLKII